VLPPLLRLPDEAAYRRHYVQQYCNSAIETHDGIRTHFKPRTFGHAFYESTKRDGVKDVFSRERAERMNWIAATLSDPVAIRCQGWIARRRSNDPARRVELLHGDFVVVLGFRLNRKGALKANFITCYRADINIGRIRASPPWTKQDCLDALRQKRIGR